MQDKTKLAKFSARLWDLVFKANLVEVEDPNGDTVEVVTSQYRSSDSNGNAIMVMEMRSGCETIEFPLETVAEVDPTNGVATVTDTEGCAWSIQFTMTRPISPADLAAQAQLHHNPTTGVIESADQGGNAPAGLLREWTWGQR